MKKVARALLSVSDKTGIVDFARGLVALGVEILSTGGTRKQLEEAGVPVRAVESYTGFPQIMDHRVVTLHPKVHGGLLAVRDKQTHMDEAAELGIEMIDMVVVNLYPFQQTVAKPGVTLAEAVENIDIGGPAMVRAAAKAFVSCEEIVDTSYFHAEQEARAVYWERCMTTGVVPIAGGAHPTSCMPEYGVDMKHLMTYNASPKEGGWEAYAKEFVAISEDEYQQKIGGTAALQALPKKSY